MPKTGGFRLDIFPHVFGSEADHSKTDELVAARRRLMAFWAQHPWHWLMGEDLVEREVVPGVWSKRLIFTTDESDQEHPIKAFPNYEYLFRWVTYWMDASMKELLANKPRQMIFTTATLLCMDWRNKFFPSRASLLSKSTEEQAEKLLREKVRDVHERLPDWVKQIHPLSPTPQSRADYKSSRSRFYALPENAAFRHAVGGTASNLLIDEAGLQDMFQTMWAKAAPMCPKMVAITTAQFGQRGAKDFMEQLEGKSPKLLVPELINPGCPLPEQNKTMKFYQDRLHIPLNSFSLRRNSRGYYIVDLCLEADPSKRSPKVLAEFERRQPNRRQFLREYRGDWTSPDGAAYYSEYDAYGGADAYSRPCPGLVPGQPVFRGWDFGGRNPCVVWVQRDPLTGRVWVLRELRCPNIGDTYALRDLVLVLSGQLTTEDLSPKIATKVFGWLDRIAADPRYPMWPWFGVGQQYRDFSSNEALRTTATVEGDDAPRFDAEVLAARGVYLTSLPIGVKARENIVRKQLRPMEDGWPGLLVDDCCPEVLELLGGGLVYKDASKNDPIPDEPKRDDKYHDLHDALGYAIVGVVQVVSDAPLHRGVGDEGAVVPFKTLKREVVVQPWIKEARRGMGSAHPGLRRSGRGHKGRRQPDIYSRLG